MFNDKIQSVKTHLSENKKVYIVGGVCLVIGAAGTVIVCTRPQTKVVVDSWKITVLKWKSPTNNYVETIVQITPRGNLGKMIYNETQDVWYTSQNEAAEKLGVCPNSVARHLKGLADHVANNVLISVGENRGQTVKLTN